MGLGVWGRTRGGGARGEQCKCDCRGRTSLGHEEFRLLHPMISGAGMTSLGLLSRFNVQEIILYQLRRDWLSCLIVPTSHRYRGKSLLMYPKVPPSPLLPTQQDAEPANTEAAGSSVELEPFCSSFIYESSHANPMRRRFLKTRVLGRRGRGVPQRKRRREGQAGDILKEAERNRQCVSLERKKNPDALSSP
ncbi:hypothetical protein P152DRAFT_11810 [Eremomyces bilateralis CBS 781.70]|uniref:Uncharacterized protein n=1 Tax=Eremomyces bilateralis CBS 781.70 TaxID=1392243 RepID=A0A6G1GH42_9PEZI|nr:uncharacterized protein P152DRAFT_11810 [Eremomyces bilateralis CBS 781.70]KAF1817221.1 hypothetical protein P152DRAFT_11810 [Eremomyces bilateralis CBS 781.70]